MTRAACTLEVGDQIIYHGRWEAVTGISMRGPFVDIDFASGGIVTFGQWEQVETDG